MGKTAITKLLAVAAVALSFVSCEDKPFEDLRSEYYARNFIKEFGLIDPEQDWNMAKEGAVTLIIGDERADVQIYGLYGDKYYLVADLKGMKGRFDVPFDVPKDCNEIMVDINGAKYYGRIGDTIDCSDHASAKSRAAGDRADQWDGFSYNPGDPWYEHEIGDVTIRTSQSSTDYAESDGYQYFNAQQMSPILDKENWLRYYSLSDHAWKESQNKPGILPEISTANRTYDEGNAKLHQNDVTQDFVFQIKNPQKGFDIFPVFYGSNLRHTLGVYLLDKNGDAVLGSDGKPLKYPIYQSKYGDDIQVATNVYELEEFYGTKNGYAVLDPEGHVLKKGASGGYEISVTVNEPYNFTVKHIVNGVPQDAFPNVTVTWNTYDKPVEVTGSNGSYTLTATNVCSSAWIQFIVDGIEHSFSVTAKRATTTKVKRIEYLDNGTPVTEISVPEGESKTLTVKCYDAESGGNVITDPNLAVAHWHSNIFTTLLNGNQLTITGVSASSASTAEGSTLVGNEYAFVYVDLSGDGNLQLDDEFNQSLHVIVLPVVEHVYTKTFDPWPELEGINYDSYYYLVPNSTSGKPQTQSGGPKTGTYSKPRRAEQGEVDYTIWTGSHTFGKDWTNPLLLDYSTYWASKAPFNSYTKLKVAFTGEVKFKIADSSVEGWPQLYYSGDWPMLSESPAYINLTSDFVNALSNEHNIAIQGEGTITGVYLVGTQPADPEDGDWLPEPDGKSKMKADMERYYNTHEVTFICNANANGHNDEYELVTNKESVDVTITITGDKKNETNISIRVSEKVVGPAHPSASQARARVPKFKSKSASSRADAIEGPGGALYRDGNTDWNDIRKRYIDGAGADSYEYDQPLLVRSRGYHVDLLVDGKPWYGYVGMYIDYDWGNYEPDASVNKDWTPGVWGRPEKGTHYSQSEHNKLAIDGHQYPISYASAFSHPASQRDYLCFEDWAVTKPVGDKDTDGNESYSGSYSGWSWQEKDNAKKGDYSSDRDLNDIIYRQYGLMPITTSEVKRNSTDGFKWTWALEDLGSADDFDFNDVVMEIESITTTSDTEIDGESSENPTIVKKITFKALAAGGTLPIFIHFAYEYNDVKEDFILYPSSQEFDLTTDKGRAALGHTRHEYHEWFGVSNSKTMINTNANGGVNGKPGGTCTIIVPSSYYLHGMPAPNVNNPGAGPIQAYTSDAITSPFYVSVNDWDVTLYDRENIDQSMLQKDQDGYLVGLPEKGAAPQSFLVVNQRRNQTIVEEEGQAPQVTGGVVNRITPWYWPKERVHILEAYPDFKKWIQNPMNLDWHETYVEGNVYKTN